MEFERRNNLFSLFISLAMAVKGMPDGFSFFKHTKLYFFHGSVFVLDDFFFFKPEMSLYFLFFSHVNSSKANHVIFYCFISHYLL